MKIKYVGPKPIISHTGIEFDNNKEDKYVYLNIAMQLLKALDHDYIEGRVYVYDANTKRLSAQELYSQIKRYCLDIDGIMDDEYKKATKEVDEELQRAHENIVLCKEDKEVLIKNIKLMRNYIVQRLVNKSVYYCIIDEIAKLLKKDHIDHIIVPMFQKFAHVLHSVQGSIRRQNIPIDTKMEVYEDGDKLFAKLSVINMKSSM